MDYLEIVKNFNYLGIIFTRTGNFSLTKKHLADKALKAMYEVLKMGRMNKIKCQCQVTKIVLHILFYSSHLCNSMISISLFNTIRS
jgi:hypothetical protein